MICFGVFTRDDAQARAVTDEGPAVYLVRVFAVTATGRDSFVDCLDRAERPFWQGLRAENALLASSVFESNVVLESEPGVPAWNFIVLSHLANGVAAENVLLTLETRAVERGRCESGAGVELKRVEVMRSTPNANYARENMIDAPAVAKAKATYVIEYIAVEEAAALRDLYNRNMRENVGPAEAFLIKEGWDLSFLALETISVAYAASDMPAWNLIHLGLYAKKSNSRAGEAANDAALRRVNPRNGGYRGVYESLPSMRTKPRVAEMRQLFDLGVR